MTHSWGWPYDYLFAFLSRVAWFGQLKWGHSVYFKEIKAGDKNTRHINGSPITLIKKEDTDADIVFVDGLIFKYTIDVLLLNCITN